MAILIVRITKTNFPFTEWNEWRDFLSTLKDAQLVKEKYIYYIHAWQWHSIRDLNSYCITRHMHYKRSQQCSLISAIFIHNKKKIISAILMHAKKSWRFSSHVYINRLGGKSWAVSVLKPFAPAIQSFLCIGTL